MRDKAKKALKDRGGVVVIVVKLKCAYPGRDGYGLLVETAIRQSEKQQNAVTRKMRGLDGVAQTVAQGGHRYIVVPETFYDNAGNIKPWADYVVGELGFTRDREFVDYEPPEKQGPSISDAMRSFLGSNIGPKTSDLFSALGVQVQGQFTEEYDLASFGLPGHTFRRQPSSAGRRFGG